MERWNNGRLERKKERIEGWKNETMDNGMMGCWIPQYSNIPIFQYSNTPG